MPELRAIAFGVIYYESAVWRLLPRDRQTNTYCRVNTQRSKALKNLPLDDQLDMYSIWRRIEEINDADDLRDFMQSSEDPKKARRVLWNFDNIRFDHSGTVEFRGGPCLLGSRITKRWIAFTVTFIHMCIRQVSDLPQATGQLANSRILLAIQKRGFFRTIEHGPVLGEHA